MDHQPALTDLESEIFALANIHSNLLTAARPACLRFKSHHFAIGKRHVGLPIVEAGKKAANKRYRDDAIARHPGKSMGDENVVAAWRERLQRR